MWRFVDRLLQLVLLTASASAVFVVGAVVTASLRGEDAPTDVVAPADEPAVEVRVSSQGSPTRIFVGQPLVVHVELVNLEARRARRQVTIDPTDAAPTAEILLDDGATPWEHRLAVTLTTDETVVLSRSDLRSRLLDPNPIASGRRLGLASARTTFILDGPDLSRLAPGPIAVSATLPPAVVPPERIRVVPLTLELRPTPTNDPDRAAISLAVARVAALRGEFAAAIEAGLTTVALDPLQDEAFKIMGESWEQQGDIDRALGWYERYLETLPDSDSDDRAALEAYIRALRRQR